MTTGNDGGPAPNQGAVSVLIDPATLNGLDTGSVADSVFELVTQMLNKRGLGFDFDNVDSDENETYADAMDALYASVKETCDHSMYLRHWALSVVANMFSSGRMLKVFESNDSQEFAHNISKLAEMLSRHTAVAVAASAAALVVLPNDAEFMMPDNETRRLIPFNVRFFPMDDEANRATVAAERSADDEYVVAFIPEEDFMGDIPEEGVSDAE